MTSKSTTESKEKKGKKVQKDLEGKEKKEKKVVRTLEATITKTELSKLVKPMEHLRDEALLKVDKNKMTYLCVDPAHVAMMQIEIPKKVFNVWKLTLPKGEKEASFAIELFKLKEVMKLATGMDRLEMFVDIENGSMQIKLKNLTRNFRLIDTEQFSEPKIPNLNLNTTVNIKNEHLRKGLDAVSTVSDHVVLIVENEEFIVMAQGDTDEVEMRMEKDELEELSGENCRSLFPLDYIMTFSKAIASKLELEMKLGTDYPTMIEIEDSSGWDLLYLLAPRIEAE